MDEWECVDPILKMAVCIVKLKCADSDILLMFSFLKNQVELQRFKECCIGSKS